MSTATKLTYLNTTKTMLRDSLNKFGSSILSTDTFRSYDTKLNEIYDKLPKVTQSGAGFTLENVQNGQVDDFKMIGTDLEQNGTPSPDYPQDIKVVEGRQVITVKGKNLFQAPTTPSEFYKATYTKINENSFSLNYTQSSTSNFSAFARIDLDISKLKPDTEYTISTSITFDGVNFSNIGALRTRINGENGSVINSNSLTFTTPNTIENVGIYFYIAYMNTTTGTATITFNNIQVEESSTATDYEPYYNLLGYNIDLHGKNVFNLEKYPFTPKVAYSSTGYQELNWTGYSGIKDYFPINGNTTYSFSNSTGLDIYYGLVFYDKNKTIISNITAHTTTFTTPSNCEYIRFSIHTEELPTWVQIEEGSTTTNYEEYYDYKLAKMPNTTYKNRIYKNNGNWYYEKNVEKFILDGSETWDSASSITNTSRFYTSSNILNSRDADDNNVYIIADKFKGISWKGIYSDDTTTKNAISNYNNSSNTSGRIVIRIDNNYASTINEFKTWLSTHNVIVYYVLATPVTTQITNTTLISQLEAISVHTGTNIITLSSDNNMTPQIEITRLKELERLT